MRRNVLNELYENIGNKYKSLSKIYKEEQRVNRDTRSISIVKCIHRVKDSFFVVFTTANQLLLSKNGAITESSAAMSQSWKKSALAKKIRIYGHTYVH